MCIKMIHGGGWGRNNINSLEWEENIVKLAMSGLKIVYVREDRKYALQN